MRNSSQIAQGKKGAANSNFLDLNKSYDEILQESENKVAGAMLGQKIKFNGFDHAAKTINEIRNSGIMRNKIKEKL